MYIVAFVSHELAMTQSAEFCGGWALTGVQRLLESLVIIAIVAFTGGTPFTVAGMMIDIVVIEPAITLVAVVRLVVESLVGITSIVVIDGFEESNDLVGG